MEIITPGHTYDLDSHKLGGVKQRLNFVHKEKAPDSDKLTEIRDGTTTEEVIDVLIDRINHLNHVLPAVENATVVTYLRRARKALEERTERRRKRLVEGTMIK